MKNKDEQLGLPAVFYKNTKAAIEALTGVGEGAGAYATDTNEFGSYDGATWTWGQGTPAPATTAANDFQLGNGSGSWVKKTLAEVITVLRSSLNSVYAASSHTHGAGDVVSGTLDSARLPTPTTTTLGGVKRNTGSAGDFVTGINSSGELEYDTPAGGGGDYTISAQSVTTTNVTAAEGTFYVLDVSGLTADRDFILPTPSAADKKIKLTLKTGDNTYSLIIKRNGIAITELFISGETLEFISTGTGAGNWIVIFDGRIPCMAQIKNSGTQSFLNNTDTKVTLDELVIDNCSMADITNSRFTIRRASFYTFYLNMRFDRFTTAAGPADGYIMDGSSNILALDEKSVAISRRPTVAMNPNLYMTKSVLVYFYAYQQSGGSVNSYNVSGQSQVFSALEILSSI